MSRLRTSVLLLLCTAAPALEAFRLTSLSSLANHDLWWHLSTGQWILQNHALPRSGIFSQSSDLPWIASSWAYEVLFATGHRVLDLRSVPLTLMLFKAALAIVTFALAGDLCGAGALVRVEYGEEVSKKFWLAVFLSVLTQYILSSLPLGPGYCSVIFFAVELLLLLQYRRTGHLHLLYWSPPLFLVWANVDIQFVYGIGLIVLFAVAHSLQDGRQSAAAGMRLKPLAIVVALSLLATLLNPYFHRPWTNFFATVTSPANRYFGEFHAMSFHQPEHYVLLLLTMAAFLMLGRQRSRDLFLIVLLVACTALSFHSQRDAWLVALVSIAVVATQYPMASTQTQAADDNVSAFLPPGWPCWEAGTGYWVLALIVVLAVMAALIPRQKMLAKLAEAYPVAAADTIRGQHLPQPIFNSYEFGGFLTWYLRDYPVAIDGRAELYGPEFMIQYSKAMNADIPYNAYPTMRDARTLLFARDSILGQALAGVPAFELIYRDDVAVVLEKQDGSHFPVPTSQKNSGGR